MFIRTDILVYVIIIVIIIVIYVIRASETAKMETELGYNADRNMEQLENKYREMMDINLKLLEEIRQLKSENSCFSKQTYDSDLMNNSEFRQNLKDLIILSHPDKHGGHERAKRITQWLLQLRQKYQKQENNS